MGRRRVKVDKTSVKLERVLYVLCEGPTEINYFEHVKKILNLSFKIKPKKKSKLGKDIKVEIAKVSEQFGIYEDELVLIYDLENSQEEYDKFIKNGYLVHMNTYLTQSCIETHFLLHHKDSKVSQNQFASPEATLSQLQKHDPKYQKGDQYKWNITSEQILLAKQRSIDMFGSYSDLRFSTIGHFIDFSIMRFQT